MQKWRAKNDGVRDKGRCKGRVAGLWLRLIFDERPSSDEGLNGMWCDWLKVLVCGILRLRQGADGVAMGGFGIL